MSANGNQPPSSLVTKSLLSAKRSYSLDPYKFDKWTLGSVVGLVIRPVALVVFSPAITAFSVSFYALMAFGPRAIRNKILSKMIPTFMSKVATKFEDDRRILLSDIAEGDRVLDLGSGGGAYMCHFSKASEVVAIEPVSEMHDKIRESAKKAGICENNLTITTEDIETYLSRNSHVQGTFDWVVLGNVLCEVSDQRSTLEAVKDALKVGGTAYFSEHIANPRGTISRYFQDLINPAWNVVSGGCNCNRDSLDNIHSMREFEVIFWRYHGLTVCFGPFVLGLARKIDACCS